MYLVYPLRYNYDVFRLPSIKGFLLYLGVFFIFLIPRVSNLGSDIANFDAVHYWYPRIETFNEAILEGRFADTYVTYHPGTTMLWLSGAGNLAFQKYFEYKHNFNPIDIPHQFTRVQFASTFPIVFVISLLGLINYLVLKRLVGKPYALIFVVLLSVEPFFLGISRFLHLTALSTMFGFTSLLFAVLATKVRQKKYLVIAGIMLGLGVATKISVIIFLPIIALYLLAEFIRFRKIKFILISSLLFVLTMVVTFVVVSPYMWVSPLQSLNKIYVDGILETALDDSGGLSLSKQPYLYYLEQSFYRLAPYTFVLYLLGIFLIVKNYVQKKPQSRLYLAVLIYFIVYYLALSIPSKLKDRYLVELIPSYIIFATYAFTAIYNSLAKTGRIVMLTIVGLLILLNLYRYYPVYSFYFTDFVGGPAGIEKLGLPVTNRGEYYIQAALYINEKDGAVDDNVYFLNDAKLPTFSTAFIGKAYADVGNLEDNAQVHYVVGHKRSDSYIPRDKCKLEISFGPHNPLGYGEVEVYRCAGAIKEDFQN